MAPIAAVPGVLLSLLLLGGVALEFELSEPVGVSMPTVMAGMLVVLVVPLLSVPLRHAFRKITAAVDLAVLVMVQIRFLAFPVALAAGAVTLKAPGVPLTEPIPVV